MSEFKREKYIDTIRNIHVPEGARNRILNGALERLQEDAHTDMQRCSPRDCRKSGHRRSTPRRTLIVAACLLLVLISGTAVAVQGSGRTMLDYFTRGWNYSGTEDLPADYLLNVQNLTIPIGISQTVGDLTLTVESAVYSDGYYWILVNGEGMDFGKRNYAFERTELQILTDDGENIARTYGGQTGMNRERTLLQMLLMGKLAEGTAAELVGKTVTFQLNIEDVMTGKKHLDEVALEGNWQFTFPVTLTAVKDPVTVPDFIAEYDPIFDYDKEKGQKVDVRNVSITAGEICFQYNTDHYTGPLPRVLLENGGEVGSAGGHLVELEDGWFDCEYRWVMPVDTSQISALQFGNTVMEIE